jgi:hypothetical protein
MARMVIGKTKKKFRREKRIKKPDAKRVASPPSINIKNTKAG